MSERATVTVEHAELSPGGHGWRFVNIPEELAEGDYHLVPADAGLLTVEEVMDVWRAWPGACRGEWYPEDGLRAALEARAQPGEEEESKPRIPLATLRRAAERFCAGRATHPEVTFTDYLREELGEDAKPTPSAHPREVRVGDVWQYFDCPLRTVTRIDPVSGKVFSPDGWLGYVKEMLDPALGWVRISEGPEPDLRGPEDMGWEDARRNKPPQPGDCWKSDEEREAFWQKGKELFTEPEPAAPLPAVGSWWWHPEKGLERVVPPEPDSPVQLAALDGGVRWTPLSEWPGAWEPVTVCCGEGCAFFYPPARQWRNKQDFAVQSCVTGFSILSPCRRILGVKDGKPTVSGQMVDLDATRASMTYIIEQHLGERGETVAADDAFAELDKEFNALAVEPLGEEGT